MNKMATTEAAVQRAADLRMARVERLRSLCKADAFQEFLADLMRECGPAKQPGPGPTNEVFYQLGRTNLGGYVLQRIAEIDEDLAAKLIVRSFHSPIEQEA